MRIVFIVDDNLIGNKKAIKEILREIIGWQEERNYPLTLFTEASIDLADDPELLALMVEANFIATFIGIESPDEESLRGAKKYQNVRSGGTMLEKVHRIQEAGIEVWCGMIMGFDQDDVGIFDRQIEFIQQGRIAFSMSGMLSAIPKTPLYDRLAADGRLDLADTCEYGTNVVPLLMSREELRDGYVRVLERALSNPRLTSTAPKPCSSIRRSRSESRSCDRWYKSPRCGTVGNPVLFPGRRALHPPDDPRGRAAASPRVSQAALAVAQGASPPGSCPFYLFHMAMHFHAHQLAKRVASGKRCSSTPTEARCDPSRRRIIEGSPLSHSPDGSSRFPTLPIINPAVPAARTERAKYGGLFYLGIGGLVVLVVLVAWFGHGLWANREAFAAGLRAA